jgi:hypothetical protein
MGFTVSINYGRRSKNNKNFYRLKYFAFFSVYVETGFADSDMVTIDINLANEESGAKFNILVSQIPCTTSYRYTLTHIYTVAFIYLDVLGNMRLL